MKVYTIHIQGLVQGVGFRPFVYRIALRNGLKGTVENRNDGVWIQVMTDRKSLDSFIRDITTEAPQASEIRKIEIHENKQSAVFPDFRILKSRDQSAEITLVSPDIAVCDQCLEDMARQPHRINYPFINCTHCGPRFTIIEDLPYDRSRTTMSVFEMCSICRSEYEDVTDRRFHAQPVACHTCGPHYTLVTNGIKTDDQEKILDTCSQILIRGGIIAVKGMGGYFLACDALNEVAVDRLRKAKLREDKPFAVMFRNMDVVREFAEVDPEEEKLLTSWRRPIVLLPSLKELAPRVTMGFDTVGAMLPYMPFHHLLFEKCRLDVIVLTSGNLSDEPIVIGDDEALARLGPVSDAVLSYNRRIHNRVDDSVVHKEGERIAVIRRSRGYAPSPVELTMNVDGILATGAELANTFCLGKNNLAFLSQHIGDLKNYETYNFYTESLERFQRLFRVTPATVVCDMHPDYLSTGYALESGLPVIRVQHHHAHIAAAMAEYGLDEPVIGIAFDGTGYGTDGNIWGGEFLVCDLQRFERKYHLEYVPMPGGDRAALEPWRMGLSWLWHVYGDDLGNLKLPFLEWVENAKRTDLILRMMEKKINTPQTSSCGRLFDAVAAITGVCRESTFHAEAPMRLEAAIEEGDGTSYPWSFNGERIVLVEMFRALVHDLQTGVTPAIVSHRFHCTLSELILRTAEKIRSVSGLNKIVLSGGSFQNRYLLARADHLLGKQGFEVVVPMNIPVNDGGVSLGQLIIGAARKNESRKK